MDREILFRAWNKKEEIMVYSNEDESAGYWDGVCLSNIDILNNIFTYYNREKYIYMQYTGLSIYDNIIWESDILFDDLTEIYYLVVYKDSGFKAVSIDDNLEHELSEIYLDCEIVGNKFDNPELLKEV